MNFLLFISTPKQRFRSAAHLLKEVQCDFCVEAGPETAISENHVEHENVSIDFVEWQSLRKNDLT